VGCKLRCWRHAAAWLQAAAGTTGKDRTRSAKHRQSSPNTCIHYMTTGQYAVYLQLAQ
jgi:hypothetical protein